MSTSKFLRLPNGQSIRPFMIASVSPSESGVQILGTSGNLIGFINHNHFIQFIYLFLLSFNYF